MWYELFGSREVVIGRDGMTGKRIFVCEWFERYDVIPSMDSQWPDDPRLHLVKTTFTPEGQSKVGYPNDEYTHCRVVCEYSSIPVPTSTATASYDFYTEILEVGGGRLWTTSGKAIQQPLNIVYPKMREVLNLPYAITSCATMLAYVGKINSAIYHGSAIGVVLFEGVSALLDWDGDAYRTRCTFNFVHSAMGWNYAWNADTGAWDTTNPVLYSSVDLNGLGI